MKDLSRPINSWIILLVYSGWIFLMEIVPYIYRFIGLGGRINSSVLAASRITILLLWTYCFVRVVEKKTFSAGFNISFQKWMRSVVWGVIFAVIALVAVSVFQFVIVIPILNKMVAASNTAVQVAAKSRGEKLLEYAYVVYEGFIEVLIFIGFLLDRLAARWKPAAALAVSEEPRLGGGNHDYLARIARPERSDQKMRISTPPNSWSPPKSTSLTSGEPAPVGMVS